MTMTTNQTIDGVPRELLAQWLAMFEGGIASSPLSALRELTRKYLQTEPAAQPQGEPVAWQYRVSAGPQTGWSLWHDGKGEEFKQSYQVETRPLYAERPAPVALALPDRDRLRDLIAQAIGSDTYDCVRVWSAWGVGTMSEDDFVPVVEQEARLYEIADACLDELKRLNPGRQP